MTLTVKEMANAFSSYFVDKIADIRKQIRSALKSVENGVSVSTRSRTFTGTLLSAFDVVTVDEVIKLINSLPNKSSPLDVLPTSLLKSSCDIFCTSDRSSCQPVVFKWNIPNVI